MSDNGNAGYATIPLRINLSLASKGNLLNFMLIGQHIILALGAGAANIVVCLTVRFSVFCVCMQLIKTYIPDSHVYSYSTRTSAALYIWCGSYN